VKQVHKRDFWVYVRSYFAFRGLPYGEDVTFEKGDRPTIRCYVDLDGAGRLVGDPQHPRVLRAAILGKRRLNMQIKEWASGYAICGGMHYIETEMLPEMPWLPEWVIDAIVSQYYAHYYSDYVV
jgi:hypothetical protein